MSEPDAEVQVLNEKDTVEITRKGDNGPITITVVPGKHRLKVQKDGFEIFTDSFEIKSGNTEAIKATLVPMEKPAVAGDKSWETPAFQQWMKDVAAMPAEKQVEAVSKKLMELNPGFDGKVTEARWKGTPNDRKRRGHGRLGFATDQCDRHFAGAGSGRLKALNCSGSGPERRAIVRLVATQRNALDEPRCRTDTRSLIFRHWRG